MSAEAATLRPGDPCAFVVFGAMGDLTKRKLLPSLYNLRANGQLPADFAFVGVARRALDDAGFREHATAAVREFATRPVDDALWAEFARRIHYVKGDFEEPGTCEALSTALAHAARDHGTSGNALFYLATPPEEFRTIVRGLGAVGLTREDAGWRRVVIEKPFGRDLDSARKLNVQMHSVFEESQIFRIDHYLGKETVQNVMVLRFANGMFEPIWNRRYVDNVQITVAEDIGIEGRGAFYDQTGTIRDMVATHLLQVVTILAMEPPVSYHPDRLRDEKVRVLRSICEVDPAKVVRGQYRGYRDEPDVAPDSQTETFAAVQLDIENWRWAGVPFNLRTGKKLARKVTEASHGFRHVPFNVFKGTDARPVGRDALVVRIQPNEGISVNLSFKKPGVGLEMEQSMLDFDYEESFRTPLVEAYELLLLEAMAGDHTLFTRWDEVERSWEVLQPVLDDPPPVFEYEPGSWGPEAADELILPRHWHVTPPRE